MRGAGPPRALEGGRAPCSWREATDLRPQAVCQRREMGRSCVIRSGHDPHGEDREPADRRTAAAGHPGLHRRVLERGGRAARPRGGLRDVLPDGLRRDRRLSPHAHPPLVQDLQARRVLLRRGRLDGGPGTGHQLGRRPSKAPRPHRRGGRSALTARRRRQGNEGRLPRAAARPRRLAADRARSRRPGEVRPRPRRGPRDAHRRQGASSAGSCSASRCPRRWAGSSPAPTRARSPGCSGAASSASSSCTT